MQKNAEFESVQDRRVGLKLFRNIEQHEYAEWRKSFMTTGVVIFDNILLDGSFKAIKEETERMLDFAKRKDLVLQSTITSERKMSTVGGRLLKANSPLLHGLYQSSEVNSFLKSLTNEDVYPVPDENEDIVINCLHKKTDVHGRHIDTYAFAFNLMISAPPVGAGGELAIYSGAKMQSYHIMEGSFYLIRTDKYEHEVLSLTAEAERLVVNMSYSNEDNKDLLSYSSDILYS